VIPNIGENLVGETAEAVHGTLGGRPRLDQGAGDAQIGPAAQFVRAAAASQCDLHGAGAAGGLTESGDPPGIVGDLLGCVIGIHPSPTVAARRSAAGPSPPICSRGACAGLGSNITGPKSKNSP
jgi:hypothetical protein